MDLITFISWTLIVFGVYSIYSLNETLKNKYQIDDKLNETHIVIASNINTYFDKTCTEINDDMFEDLQQLLTSIENNDDKEINIIIDTGGGDENATINICKIFIEFKKKTNKKINVYIPYIAMSGGSMIALAIADKLYIGSYALMGPIDTLMPITTEEDTEYYPEHILTKIGKNTISEEKELAKIKVQHSNKETEKLMMSFSETCKFKNSMSIIIENLLYGEHNHYNGFTVSELEKFGVSFDKILNQQDIDNIMMNKFI